MSILEVQQSKIQRISAIGTTTFELTKEQTRSPISSRVPYAEENTREKYYLRMEYLPEVDQWDHQIFAVLNSYIWKQMPSYFKLFTSLSYLPSHQFGKIFSMAAILL